MSKTTSKAQESSMVHQRNRSLKMLSDVFAYAVRMPWRTTLVKLMNLNFKKKIFLQFSSI